VSQFYPTYKLLDKPRTPVATLRHACEIGYTAGLKHVYEGNVRRRGESTYCPSCGQVLIKRFGYVIQENTMRNGSCPACNTVISGIWDGDEQR